MLGILKTLYAKQCEGDTLAGHPSSFHCAWAKNQSTCRNKAWFLSMENKWGFAGNMFCFHTSAGKKDQVSTTVIKGWYEDEEKIVVDQTYQGPSRSPLDPRFTS